MLRLEKLIRDLESWLRPTTPAWSEVALIDAADVKYQDGRPYLARGDLKSIDEFEKTFVVALAQGYSWLNLSALGVAEGTLVVVLEGPSKSVDIPTPKAPVRTSVNFAGPSESSSRLTIYD